MTIPFQNFFERVCSHTDIASQMDLANALGIHRSAITQAKLRDAVPQKWILALARRYNISPDWLEFGHGPKATTNTQSKDINPSFADGVATLGQKISDPSDVELVFVPKVKAKVCAGGGSYEIEAVPVSEHPFPRQWLSKMGRPSAMIFMDVIGSSMEPGIRDGDMVLVDQSGQNLSPHSVFAVGYEDSIFIKRVEPRNGGIILHSDNPSYSDIELSGDELSLFRIIGRVVWLCRDV